MRVLLEKHRVDLHKSGKPRLYTVLELVVWTLKKRALDGDQKAHKAFMEFERTYGSPDPEPEHGFLIVPERLTLDEWIARYSPPDDGPPTLADE